MDPLWKCSPKVHWHYSSQPNISRTLGWGSLPPIPVIYPSLPIAAQFANQILYISNLVERISSICPGGAKPTVCECDNSPKDTISPPFDFASFGLFRLLGCSPSFCKCADGTEVNARTEETLRLMELCPRGKMAGCECADGQFQTVPFELKTFFSQCRPIKVSESMRAIKMTGF